MKKSIINIASFLITTIGFAQQIGDGLAPGISTYIGPINSGVYSGFNAIGGIPDTSHNWNHFFVIRHGNPNNVFQLQMASSYTENDRLFFRKTRDELNPTWMELATRGTNTFVGNQIFNGNIGVGNTNPLAKLDISGDLILRNYENIGGKGNKIIFTSYSHDLHGPQIRSYLMHASGVDSRMGLVLSSYTRGFNDELFLIDGNVGIGITTPQNKLDVNGTIHSKEVKVDMIGWSDFVFKKEYKLPTLAEVEKHINEKGHLENIPNEAEVLENGINLGEMNAKLLQKIEELTLYMIEMKKENAEIKKENTEMNKRLTKLENK